MQINKPLSPHLLVGRQEAVGNKLPPLIGSNQIQRHLRKAFSISGGSIKKRKEVCVKLHW